ncbi:MAG TPA: radical SAM protein [Candidatus Methylacidiphilales bacterium]|nr:radical SAM protein [Candidatus Methylacidiphilales bacterium]
MPPAILKERDIGSTPEQLRKQAMAVRNQVFGQKVFVRGVLEVSNFCRQNCHYCGMRRDNRPLQRYRLSLDSLRVLVREGFPEIITDINIQTGEDIVGIRETVLPLIDLLRRETRLGVSVCLGTLDPKIYDELRQAGASYYIIKLETGNRGHYREINAPGTFDERLEAIHYLAKTGWAVSSGFILGLPGQTGEHIEETLELLSELPLAGASVSPFIAGEQTPFAGQSAGQLEATIDCIARMRLRNPSYIIPAVSALNLVGDNGYVRALKAGANLATINLTPHSSRPDYLLYKRDRYIMDENRVKKTIEEAGCVPGTRSIAQTLGQLQKSNASSRNFQAD